MNVSKIFVSHWSTPKLGFELERNIILETITILRAENSSKPVLMFQINEAIFNFPLLNYQ